MDELGCSSMRFCSQVPSGIRRGATHQLNSSFQHHLRVLVRKKSLSEEKGDKPAPSTTILNSRLLSVSEDLETRV